MPLLSRSGGLPILIEGTLIGDGVRHEKVD
jgi:hypothetical protein